MARRRTLNRGPGGWRVPVSEDRWPGEDGQEELYAAFAALGGPLTRDEFMQIPRDTVMRFLGSPVNLAALVRLASLLLGGDIVAAEAVVQDSFAALQDAWSRLGDLAKARLYLYQAIVNRSRSVRRRWHAGDHKAPDAPGAGHAATGGLDREPPAGALGALPDRQFEAVVLRNYMGLSEQQAAVAMGISTGAARAHLARGTASLPRPPRPKGSSGASARSARSAADEHVL
jgi:DNA-directed RNA polymerase specialized sigma24 family protein